MTVTVTTRGSQSTPLSYVQMDSNFTNLANAVNLQAIQNGTTSQRPTTITNPAVYVGMQYLDFTLGNGSTTAMPIWCTNITGTTVTWSNAAGVAV